MKPMFIFWFIAFLAVTTYSLTSAGNIMLFPDTENSPSIYLLTFQLQAALPSNSYILVTMDWYSAALNPYNCILVNTTIPVSCTNLANPTFPLTITPSQITNFNSLANSAQTVAVLISSNLLAGTTYSLQLHLYNVIPNIQKISPSIEIYTVSYNGLIYQYNPNFGSVINHLPNTNLMSVSILNSLTANSPGSVSTLSVQVAIGQAVSTALSTFIFVMPYPFSFSIGSIPTSIQSTLYATNPIPLYQHPTILSYQVISPNVFQIVFNEQFIVGRQFIIKINQISNPFTISSANISIYSLNYNTLTPLQAFEMLYPIATTSYSLTVSLGLPFSAPFQGSMQYYYNTNQFIQLQFIVPYSIPNGYSIRITLASATFLQGSAYSSLTGLTYTPVYNYFDSTNLIISQFGPIAIGTVITITFQFVIATLTLFQVSVYIDTNAVITAFTASSYMYQGFSQSSAVQTSSFLTNINDNIFNSAWNVQSNTVVNAAQWYTIQVYQNIGSSATSTGSYLEMYLSPNVIISPSFNQNTDCRLQINGIVGWTTNSCIVTYSQTATYFKITVQANTAFLNSYTNLFPYRIYSYISLTNLIFSVSSTNKNLYPVYVTLYKSAVVNPTPYYTLFWLNAMPTTGVSGVNFHYASNYYATSNYQTYPGALRFESTNITSLNLIVQPNQQLSLIFYSAYGFRSFPLIGNMQSYPCISNIPITCTYYQGLTGYSQIFYYDRIVVTFLDTSYSTTLFHILVPDTQTTQMNNYMYYGLGFYNLITKDWTINYYGSYLRAWNLWISSPASIQSSMAADISGKAGSYRNNVSVVVYNSPITLGQSFVLLSTQWSFFEVGLSQLSQATLSMATPATFGANNIAPLSVYMTGGMYLTVIPFTYTASTSPFTFYIDNVHMPYSYDLPSYYIYVAKAIDQRMASSNSFVMMNGGTLYSSPLQSLTVACQDNAIGVVSTYCTIVFGTSNPLLATGNIRLTLSGMTVATNICYLTSTNGQNIPVTCSSSSDNSNVTISMSGWQFYKAGNFMLVVYGIGLTQGSLSQSITLNLYDSSISYVIETGVRILTTTIASLYYINLNEIMYSYLNPLSYTTMQIMFYLPRMLYQDEQFAFVIGSDLSGVNTEQARLSIVITRFDGVQLYPLFSIDNINYLIVFSFPNASLLTIGNYVMTIYGICTPASQSSGAFNMIYRRIYDSAYTIVNSANVIFPTLDTLVTSNISLKSYFNTEGYKQQIDFTLVNSALNVDSNIIWVINFPSYYSSTLFQQDSYCMINSAVIPCAPDPNTPYQLIITSSPKTVNAGTAYVISVVGLACPRAKYTNSAYPSRYIFIGVLQNSASTSYTERALLLPQQAVQSTVAGVVNVMDMIGVSTGSLYAFSSIYAQFQLMSSVAIASGSYLLLDLPQQFDNLNNIALNAILIYGSSVISSTTTVVNRRIEILIFLNITLKTSFRVQFPNLPTPKAPCRALMSDIIVIVTPSSKVSVYSASSVQGNSAPMLTFVKNSLYISFNYDQTVVITAGTYSRYVNITSSSNGTFLSNINVNLTSTGFLFEPSNIFLPLGASYEQFRIGADQSLVPVVYFYQGTKQEQVNTNYQMTLNMNIQVTDIPVLIVLPTNMTMPLGGCTNSFIISLPNPPFYDLTISYTFDNAQYSESNFYPNPIVTPVQMTFNSMLNNATFSFCSTSSLSATQIPVYLHLSGTNYKSYSFTPSNAILINIVNTTNINPTLSLRLNNQQKTFLDVNFTNNVAGTIFYQMMVGANMIPLDLQSIQIYMRLNTWVLQCSADFMNYIYTTDIDNRFGQFFQAASTTTVRISNLLPQSFYTLCAYLVNNFGVATTATCLQLSTMTWGTAIKASIKFSQPLTVQQMNNVLCFFTSISGTSQLYLVDMQGNSCGNRAVSNIYYNYTGTSFVTETQGTNVYLITNPNIVGTDPSPFAFTSLFSSGTLSAASLASAQSMFSINYLTGTYITSYNARLISQPSQASNLAVYFSTPIFNSNTQILTVSDIQIVGNVGTIYFVLVLYKTISKSSNGTTSVNIRMNEVPSAVQVLNCQNWESLTANGCARAVYTGISPLTVTFSGVQSNSLYKLYYLPASEFPIRPIVSGQVSSSTVVTFAFGSTILPVLLWMLILFLI